MGSHPDRRAAASLPRRSLQGFEDQGLLSRMEEIGKM
jgi:hypothetical protein